MEKEKKAYVIAVANHKGGVAKTTTTASVGTVLAMSGKNVLLVDVDAQANLTSSLTDTEQYDSIEEAMKGEMPLPIIKIHEHLDIVPSSLNLALAEVQLSSAIARETILSRLLAPYRNSYDYIIIDCPPSLGLMTSNALTAADGIIIPMSAEILPYRGLEGFYNFQRIIQANLNPKLRILGILMTRCENTKLSRMIFESLQEQNGSLMFKTRIRKNVTVAEAPLESKSLVLYAPNSNGAIDYKSFTKELIEKIEKL